MALKIGIPRALMYYYMFPFFQGFLKGFGYQTFLSPRTSRITLDYMSSCPTDEPCVSTKLVFGHVKHLLEQKVDHIFIPNVVSTSPESFYCPKIIGVADMVRSAFGLDEKFVLSPTINVAEDPKGWPKTWHKVAGYLGVKDQKKVEEALTNAENAQRSFRAMTARGITTIWAYSAICGVLDDKLKQSEMEIITPVSRETQRALQTIGVVGHAYTIYDFIGHGIIEKLSRYGKVLTPEMVPDQQVYQALDCIWEGRKMWPSEAQMLGAALYWLGKRVVDRLVLVGTFECGPESIVENFILDEADRCDIPVLILSLDEHTGEAGIVTRIEAFMDSAADPAGDCLRTPSSPDYDASSEGIASVASPQVEACATSLWHGMGSIKGPEPCERRLGIITMGHLGIALTHMFHDMGVDVVPLPKLSDETVVLGKELSPEFICYPMITLLGEMRQLIHMGANTLLMVVGKGRCRLGWYAQVQEILLRKAGYEFIMPVIGSPFPLRTNLEPFLRVAGFLGSGVSWDRAARSLWVGFRKMIQLDEADEMVREARAYEVVRGEADRIHERYISRIQDAGLLSDLKRARADFLGEMQALERSDTNPVRIRVLGEIYVILEPFVNGGIEKVLGSQKIRVRVHRELSATNWFYSHILRSPSHVLRERKLLKAAYPYLKQLVGGHGTESVGGAVLAGSEGMDGVVHIFPFTCMPEIVAQNIMVRVSDTHDIPTLSIIVNEQKGEVGTMTRIEAFLDLLEERRRYNHGRVRRR